MKLIKVPEIENEICLDE